MAELAPVAVIVPVYNRRLKLIKTLKCVADQGKLPTLLVVVDDGSTDGTAEAAESWLARNAPFEWRVIRQGNAGVASARNAGFAHIGELPFVCFLDSDDLWPREFIAEGLRALEGQQHIVAAVADKIKQTAQKRGPIWKLDCFTANPLLWIICNSNSILSCMMIRSRAARAAGLFAPGMVAGEDADFLLRLFSLGGAAHSMAAPVLFIRQAPLEPIEAPNLSKPSPDLTYILACQRAEAVSRLPEPLLRNYDHLIRTAVARRWVAAAFSNRRAGNHKRGLLCLVKGIIWDHDFRRRRRLVWSFLRDQKKILDCYQTSLPENDSAANPVKLIHPAH